MAMNREQKRAMQKRGMSGEDGAPTATRERRAPAARPAKEARTSPRQYLREVIGELRKTSWPTRQETIRLAVIVLIAIVFMTTFIFAVDLLFGEAITRLLDTSDTPQSAAGAAALFMIRVT
jgi:preprotein translocase subunit SecE